MFGIQTWILNTARSARANPNDALDRSPVKPLLRSPLPGEAMIPFSPETKRRIQILFPPDEREGVEALLFAECGDNLPNVESNYIQPAERIRFAILKLSDGRLDKLREWINDAAKDWRDTLMSAGFGWNVVDHLEWFPIQAPSEQTADQRGTRVDCQRSDTYSSPTAGQAPVSPDVETVEKASEEILL